MRKTFLFACAAALTTLPLSAQDAKVEYPSPPEIVAKAEPQEWVTIAPSDLMVIDLAPDAKGKARRVVIQLMPAPFSQGWVGNIRKLAAAKFWDGTSVNRVQDNYVVQWGDATEKKALPDGLSVVPESAYLTGYSSNMFSVRWGRGRRPARFELTEYAEPIQKPPIFSDPYNETVSFSGGFAVSYTQTEIREPRDKNALDYSYRPFSRFLIPDEVWPIHCYGMVGVGRNLSPDTGTGAELYTVIGHAPRHLDRNIAVVGRVIEGIEHLSSLPRGTGGLGFYESEAERTPIVSVRIGADAADLPAFEYLSTESASFAAYADARANRRDPFFNVPAGGADICNIPVPVRRKVST